MSGNLSAFALTARYAPSQGSRAIQLPLDFSAATEISGDIFLSMETGGMDFVQSVKIDNADSDEQFVLYLPGIGTRGDRVIAAPRTIGTYPVFIQPGKLDYIAQSSGGVEVVVTFFNIELPYIVNSVVSGGGVAVGTATAYPLVLTGADQIIIPLNARRLRATIQNPPNNANSIWVAQGGAATADFNSQEVAPGQQFDTASGPLSTAALHVIGTNGQSIYAVEISK